MILGLVTDAQTVGKILIACATPVLAAMWFGRRKPDPWRDLARESHARAHGAAARARRGLRRQRRCHHASEWLITQYAGDFNGPVIGQWCSRCGTTLGYDDGRPLPFWRT